LLNFYQKIIPQIKGKSRTGRREGGRDEHGGGGEEGIGFKLNQKDR
jgi:hypothetical protein